MCANVARMCKWVVVLKKYMNSAKDFNAGSAASILLKESVLINRHNANVLLDNHILYFLPHVH